MRMKEEHNLGIVFICHDIALVKSISDEMVVMYHGNIVEKIAGRDIGRVQVHPYTTALIDAVFSLDMDFSKPLDDRGFTAETSKVQAKGCIYANRCPHCRERCLRKKPQLMEWAPGHYVACHLFEEEYFETMADSRAET